MFRLVFLFSLITWPLRLPFTLLAWAIWRLGRGQRDLFVSLEGHHPHRPSMRSVFNPRREGISRRGLTALVREAIEDRRVKGLKVRIGALRGGWSMLHELRAALAAAKAGGLRVDVFLAAADHRTLFVASPADAIHLQPDAAVLATGIAAEMTFFKGALDTAGVELDVITAGAYKSAMEPFARAWPSAANQEAMNALLDDLDRHLVDGISASRGVEPSAVRAIFDRAPASAEALVETGLATALMDEDAWLDEAAGPAQAYGGRARPLPRLPRRARLAVIEVRGTIRDGAFDDPTPAGATISAVVGALDAARKSRRIKGVLLHVDSPGGSATASERMWQAVRRLAEEKPVVAWMGDYAASGGYYVASAAHQIVATPGTLTGSVGVIMAKPVIGGLLDKLGLRQVRFERGAHAGILSAGRRFLDSEREALAGHIQRTYSLFLDRVCTGRDQPREWLEPLAQGRVWTGAQAEAHAMVDRIGTEEDALRALAKEAGVDWEKRPFVATIEPRRSLLSRLRPSLNAPMLELLQVADEGGTLAWCPVRIR